MDHLESIRAQIVEIGRNLLAKGLVAGTWGNVSARVPGSQLIAITPSGRDYLDMNASDIVIVDHSGTVQDGRYKPSSELQLHLAIYKHRPDINAIVHTHSVYASACAVARRPLPPVIEDLIQLAGGNIEVAEYTLPGTVELANAAVRALGDRQAVLLANHGVVGCGGHLHEAMLACELVEKAAQIFIFANSLGGAHVLSDDDVKVMRQFYLEHYRKRQEGVE